MKVMNHLAFDTAGQAIETLQQVEAVLEGFPTMMEHMDSATAYRVLWGAQSLIEREIERLEAAQMKALASEAARERNEGPSA